MKHKNTNMQGNAGVGAAIAWFTANDYTVSIPLTDTQDYDLVVDNGIISRIQVKTTTDVDNRVELRTKGGNKSGTGKTKKFNRLKIDKLFVLTGNGSSYLIPTSAFESSSQITLSARFKKFKITDVLTGVGTGPVCKTGAF